MLKRATLLPSNTTSIFPPGVVLFNYAYIVTVPSWLIEKKNEVSVNHTIWHASTLSSVIYLGE